MSLWLNHVLDLFEQLLGSSSLLLVLFAQEVDGLGHEVLENHVSNVYFGLGLLEVPL